MHSLIGLPEREQGGIGSETRMEIRVRRYAGALAVAAWLATSGNSGCQGSGGGGASGSGGGQAQTPAEKLATFEEHKQVTSPDATVRAFQQHLTSLDAKCRD